MSIHTQVALILIFGLATLATLYVLFGTSVLTYPKAVQRKQIAQSFPTLIGIVGMVGLACTVFGAHFLIFGARPFPYPVGLIIAAFLVVAMVVRIARSLLK